MCDRLSELARSFGTYVGGFDPSALGGAEALVALEDATVVEKQAGALKALLAARVHETDVLEGSGVGDTAEHLAKVAGVSKRAAQGALRAGRQAQDHQALGRAMREGQLSDAQAALVAQGVDADPGAEGRLLDAARGSLKALKDEVGRVKAAADPDPEATAQRLHAGRGLKTWVDTEGFSNLWWKDSPERGAEVLGAITAVQDRVFKAAWGAGRRESEEAYRADAAYAIVTGTDRGQGGGAKVIIRADAAALRRGRTVGEERCEASGVGPVSPAWVTGLVASLQSFVALVVTEGTEVRGVLHLGRHPTAHQVTALQWLYPDCAVEDCPSLRTQWDHRIDWHVTHHTTLGELDGLCTRHHRMKTTKGWALVEGTGKRAFVPPTDPRHPGQSGQGQPKSGRSPPKTDTG